jgi:flavin-dependent dehydrogenase
MELAVDFAVIGGGPAGAAFALAARALGATVAVIERPRPRGGAGDVLSPSVIVPLAQLGLGAAFGARGYVAARGAVSAWGGAPIDRGARAGRSWHVDRDDFDGWLLAEAIARGARVVRAAAARADRAPGRTRIAAGATTVVADFAIEASGRGRGVVLPPARRAREPLFAVLQLADAAPGEDPRLHLEWTGDGWWYSALLPRGQVVFARMIDRGRLPRGAAAARAWFARELAATTLTRARPSAERRRGPLRACPAGGAIRAVVADDHALAIGDAAASYDPLCGQGVVAALSKGAAAARLLCAGPRAAAIRAYVDAELAAFADYQRVRAALYARARG